MVIGGRNSHVYRRKSPEGQVHSVISGPLRTLELAMQQVEARKAESYRRGILPARPTLVAHGPIRMLLSATPNAASLERYKNTLHAYNVRRVVRACEPAYDADRWRESGFEVFDMPFPDGGVPPPQVVSDWLALLDEVFDLNAYVQKKNAARASGSDMCSDTDSPSSACCSFDEPTETIAVHCAAGLGRAPLLAAIALVELGLDPHEAVGYIRVLRRGAINAAQVVFLENYTRRPPPTAVKPRWSRSRSSSIVGAFWPSLKATRAFRQRSPVQAKGVTQIVSRINSPVSARRYPGTTPSRERTSL